MRICTRCNVLKLALIMYLYKHTEIKQHERGEWGIHLLFKGSVHLNDTQKNNFTKPEIYYLRRCGAVSPPIKLEWGELVSKSWKVTLVKKNPQKNALFPSRNNIPVILGENTFLCILFFFYFVRDRSQWKLSTQQEKEHVRERERKQAEERFGVWWHRCRRTTQQLYLRAYTWCEWWLWKNKKKKIKAVCVYVCVGVCVCVCAPLMHSFMTDPIQRNVKCISPPKSLPLTHTNIRD